MLSELIYGYGWMGSGMRIGLKNRYEEKMQRRVYGV